MTAVTTKRRLKPSLPVLTPHQAGLGSLMCISTLSPEAVSVILPILEVGKLTQSVVEPGWNQPAQPPNPHRPTV